MKAGQSSSSFATASASTGPVNEEMPQETKLPTRLSHDSRPFENRHSMDHEIQDDLLYPTWGAAYNFDGEADVVAQEDMASAGKPPSDLETEFTPRTDAKTSPIRTGVDPVGDARRAHRQLLWKLGRDIRRRVHEANTAHDAGDILEHGVSVTDFAAATGSAKEN